MKTFDAFTNTDKARLLHEWFPDEIPVLLRFIENRTQIVQRNKEQLEKKWNRQNELIDFSVWLQSAIDIQKRIHKNDTKLIKNNHLFTEQLFYMPEVFFTVDCLIMFALCRQPSAKFKQTILLLFS